jgi:hypothetical protein
MILPGIYAQLLLAPAVTQNLASPPALSIFINSAVKQPPRPHLVLNRVGAPPAEATLDGISDLIDGEIQLDGYADTQEAATALTRAAKTYLVETFNAGILPDGTTIQFVNVTADRDMPFEEGAGPDGRLYRALVRLQAFYTEAS